MVTILWAAVLLGATAGQGQSPLIEWRFDRPAASHAWLANRDVADVRWDRSGLRFRGAGPDPILECVEPFEISATPWQAIEITLAADHDGTAEFFWSNTTQSKYGGFFPEKHTSFAVRGDGTLRTYRIFPFWQKEGRIIRLRFDPYDGASFLLRSIRIVPVPTMRPSGPSQVVPIFGVSAKGNLLTLEQPGGFAMRPSEIDGETYTIVSLTAASHGSRAAVVFAAQTGYGLHEVPVHLVPDGRWHVYNVDMLASPDWQGHIVALGIRPGENAGDACRVRSIGAYTKPIGPPDVRTTWFGTEEALPRAGLPVTVLMRAINQGGAAAGPLRPHLVLPSGAIILDGPRNAPTLRFGEEAQWRWRVRFRHPGRYTLTAQLPSGSRSSCTISVTQRVRFPGNALPDPHPIHGKYEVGVYYFPGWKTASQWAPIQRYPERRPILGWYREGDPKVADWQIRWAVEHGITFFAYDWYWSQGSRQLEHALDDGFLKSKYRHLMKFCLLWANHNAPHTSSIEDCRAAARYWIQHYFRQPEYLRISGRPVVIIFSPYRFREDLGSEGVRKALDAMRAECVSAGIKPVYLMACVGGPGDGGEAANEGYDAVTAYNWPGLAMPPGTLRAPFRTLIEGYVRNWQSLVEQVPIPLMVPISGGWDSRPWHGDADLVRTGRTPALFRRHLADAKTFMQSHPAKTLPLAIVEAWNEFGEGSYIEPHQEAGFAYLDAIRSVFGGTKGQAPHVDVTPEDVNQEIPQVTPEPLGRDRWTFAKDLEGWESGMEIQGPVQSANGLSAVTAGDDPAFFGPPIQLNASEYSRVRIRMRLTPVGGQPFDDEGQLFWTTRTTPESEANSVRFPVFGDGTWHDYQVPLSQNRRWRTVITRLRLDPCNRSGVRVEVRSIELER
ncbi:MAG: glycoside hydrolase family 99-like domain-containing protein [Chthonomonadales bacterium]